MDMSMRTFHGGAHPPEGKAATEHKPVEDLPLPPLVVIPLQQHTGAPCTATVAVGDTVRMGQLIGDSTSAVAAPVHASITGKVAAIEPRPHPSIPKPVLAVVIERDVASAEPRAETPAAATTPADWQVMSPADLTARIRAAGVVGLGGAAFPTHVKLTPPKGKTIDTLILNGVECEPCLTSDHRLMLERAEDIIDGIRVLRKVLGVNRVLFAIEENKADAIELMRIRAKASGEPIQVVPLEVKYPQGAEKQLIKVLLDREVPSGGLPFEVGVVVQNVGTAAAVADAVLRSRPLVSRVLTVTGDGIKEPRNLRVPIGTQFSRVIEACGGFSVDGPIKLIMGGPMMGLAQYTADVPVVKGTSGILVLRHDSRDARPSACIRCGRCVEVCPMGLVPHRIAEYADLDKFALASEFGVKDCIECGACVYSCGSRRPLVHLIKYAKLNLARKKG
jgi:Na+-translocating ferredoxin:NAD+ oxidoreductase subunit C